MNNNNNNQTKKSFTDAFINVKENLSVRYRINMHLDFIQEFIKFADNTKDLEFQFDILNAIIDCEDVILNHIKRFENERNNKENID